MSSAPAAGPVWEPDEEDRAFMAVYGRWDPLTPAELAEVMAGYPHPWWVGGGHAIEAFTGVVRVHEDIDMVVFTDHVQDLRAHLHGRFHLWSAYDGTLRPLDDAHPEPFVPVSQLWMRVDADSPWQVDCLLDASDAGRWVSRRDPSHVVPLEEVTWVHTDGVRYLRPEVQLLFKAKHARPKDEVDLTHAWPLLSADQRDWLRDALRRVHPGHAWSDRLG